jgi:hypothetical protein
MTPLENLRHNITLRDGVDLDGTLTELLDYLKVLEARVEALEKGALNRPFIVPKGIGPPRNPPSDLNF